MLPSVTEMESSAHISARSTQMRTHDVSIPQSMFRSYRQPSSPAALPLKPQRNIHRLSLLRYFMNMFSYVCFETWRYLSARDWVHTPQTIQPPPVRRIAIGDQQGRARQSVSTCCWSGDLMGGDVRTDTNPSPSLWDGTFPYKIHPHASGKVSKFSLDNKNGKMCDNKVPFRLTHDAFLPSKSRPYSLTALCKSSAYKVQ
jgi:hypothetical protein